jgi:hypothetical protein
MFDVPGFNNAMISSISTATMCTAQGVFREIGFKKEQVKPRGAPVKRPRRNARELTTFRSPPENLSVRTDRVRTAEEPGGREMDACEPTAKFPVLTK